VGREYQRVAGYVPAGAIESAPILRWYASGMPPSKAASRLAGRQRSSRRV